MKNPGTIFLATSIAGTPVGLMMPPEAVGKVGIGGLLPVVTIVLFFVAPAVVIKVCGFGSFLPLGIKE